VIVVTANKREEALSTVPISIVALSNESLSLSGVKNIADLANLVPSVEFYGNAGYGSGTLSAIEIRGIYSLVGASPTGIYVDDTPIQGRLNSLSFFGNAYPLMFDVSRVEVERGPQGTLFGAGAEGGALRFISAAPALSGSGDGFARGEVAFTERGGLSYEGGVAVGAPIISDELGFRASAWYRQDGGYIDHVDPFTGATIQKNSNAAQSYALRGAVSYKPFDGVVVTPSIYAQSVHNDDAQAYFEYLSNRSEGDLRNGRLLPQPNTDRFYIPSLKLEAELGPARFTAVTSYFDRTGRLQNDLTNYMGALFGPYVSYGNPLGNEYPADYSQAGPTYLRIAQRVFSQEVRLLSADEAARLRWTVGVFYSRGTQIDVEDVHSEYYAVNLFGIPATDSLLYSSLESVDTQLATFGQVDYRLTQSLTATLGARVGHTTSKFTETQQGPIAAESPTSGKQSETPVTPKAVLSYQIDGNHMLYVSAAKGFRIGGANPPIPLQSEANPAGCPLDAQPPPYGSDSLWSYELGSKDVFLNGNLRINSSVFDVEWKKIQQNVYLVSCGFGYIANTGSATSRGFDLSAEAAVTPALTVGLSVSYTDAHITANSYTPDGNPIFKEGDAIGTPPGSLSPWNLTGSIRYAFTAIPGTRSYIRVEDIYRTRNPGPFNSQIPDSPSYSPLIPPNPATNLTNLRLGTDWRDWELSLHVNNLFDRQPALGRYNDIPSATLFTDYTFRPRTFGLSAKVKF
jgi:outer membrane receptor protein involved in Fe transport